MTTLDKPLTAEDVVARVRLMRYTPTGYVFVAADVNAAIVVDEFAEARAAAIRADLVAAIEARAQAERARDAAHTYARERCEERDLALDERDAARAETRAAYAELARAREQIEALLTRIDVHHAALRAANSVEPGKDES